MASVESGTDHVSTQQASILLPTRERHMLHIPTTGIDWTNDSGRNWHQADVPATAYYPDSIQGPDGRIYISSHVGGDNASGSVDPTVTLDTFQLQQSPR